MFVVTSSGYNEEPNIDYAKYRIPTGTFYINRTAKLLNIYLGAIYGQGRYVETCFHNENLSQSQSYRAETSQLQGK